MSAHNAGDFGEAHEVHARERIDVDAAEASKVRLAAKKSTSRARKSTKKATKKSSKRASSSKRAKKSA